MRRRRQGAGNESCVCTTENSQTGWAKCTSDLIKTDNEISPPRTKDAKTFYSSPRWTLLMQTQKPKNFHENYARFEANFCAFLPNSGLPRRQKKKRKILFLSRFIRVERIFIIIAQENWIFSSSSFVVVAAALDENSVKPHDVGAINYVRGARRKPKSRSTIAESNSVATGITSDLVLVQNVTWRHIFYGKKLTFFARCSLLANFSRKFNLYNVF